MFFSSIEIKNYATKSELFSETKDSILKTHGKIPCCGELSVNCRMVFYKELLKLLENEESEIKLRKIINKGIYNFILEGKQYVIVI